MKSEQNTPCAGCGEAVGEGAVTISFTTGTPRTRSYHAECWATACREARVAAGKPAEATRSFSSYRRPRAS